MNTGFAAEEVKVGRDESQPRAPVTLRVISSETPAEPRSETPAPAPMPPETPPPAPAPSVAAVTIPSVVQVAAPQVALPPSPPEPAQPHSMEWVRVPAVSSPPPVESTPAPSDTATAPAPPDREAAPSAARHLPYGRVVLVFLGSFTTTTALVLGAWFGALRPPRPIPRPLPAPVVVMAPAPAPAPAPVVAPEPEPEVADAATEEPVVEEPKPAPAPKPVYRRPAPRPRPAPAPAPVEEPVVAAVPEPPPPPPEPTVPDMVARHEGAYAGRVQTKDITLDLDFRPEGKLSAMIVMGDGAEEEQIRTSGTWTLADDGSVTIALVESGAAAPRVWSARVSGGEIDGRLVEDSRTTRRFHGVR